jgi:hypothetical protein
VTNPDPGLAPDLDTAAPDLPQATGQGDPTPPATPKATREADALLRQAHGESYDTNGGDPVDGTHDPYRS